MNKIFLQGRLTDNPEVRTTQSDKEVGSFKIAVDSGYGEYKNTTFFPVRVFGKKTAILKHFSKGDGVIVTGPIIEEKWDDRQTGEKRSRFVVTADDIFFPVQKPKDKDTTHFEQAKEAVQGNDLEDEIPF